MKARAVSPPGFTIASAADSEQHKRADVESKHPELVATLIEAKPACKPRASVRKCTHCIRTRAFSADHDRGPGEHQGPEDYGVRNRAKTSAVKRTFQG